MPFHDKKKEGKTAREGKGLVGHFTEYTPLAMSREKFFVEICVAELKEPGVKPSIFCGNRTKVSRDL